MVQIPQKKSARATLKKRREQVLERLAAVGLTRGPHRIVRVDQRWDREACPGIKLRLALTGLGPVFSCFGLYLATRVDLLPANDCLELAALPNITTPLSHASLQELITREIGCAPDEAFLSFESDPFASLLLHQFHHARQLQNNRPVVVKLVRPEVEQFLGDLELLELLDGALASPVRGPIFKSVVADFAAAFQRQIDLTHEATALETLQRDASDFEMLRVPEVQRGLSTPSLLTVEHLSGTPLSAWDSPGNEVSDGAPAERPDRVRTFDRPTLARLLCSVWLRQALLGHVFPVEPSLANIVVLSESQIAFTGGLFSCLPGEPQANLWDYLIASAADSPDEACSCLLKELRRERSLAADEDLNHRFRQIVPFRDSGWYRDDDRNRFIEHLVVHWRGAADCGYVPLPHLPAFYQGLFAITSLAQQLSPETDPLLEGLQEARLLSTAARMREMLSLQRMGDQIDKYAAMMMAMPQRLDQMLTLASEGNPRVKLHVAETTSHRRQKNSTAAVTAILLLLAAIAFALPRVTTSLLGADWAGRINAAAFVVCGALLVRVMSRTG